MRPRSVWVVVPARFGSVRLPGKPLAMVGGLPLVEQVRRRCCSAPGVARVLVATDDDRIRSAIVANGGEAVMTGPAPSGTHRVRLALEALGEWPEVVVNVQGDQPLIDPAHVSAVAGGLGDANIATLSAPLIGDPHDPHRVKVVVNASGRALYFSRQAIPFRGPWRQHVGVYAFTGAGLRSATESRRGPLCLAEDLEQLAWLEGGHRIQVTEVDHVAPGVDTPEQLEEIRRIIGVI